MSIRVEHYFSVENFEFSEIFPTDKPVWAVLVSKFKEQWIDCHLQPNVHLIETQDGLVQYTQRFCQTEAGWQKLTSARSDLPTFEVHAGAFIKDAAIELRAGVVVESGAYIAGPTLIGEGTVVRHGAYIRGGVITGTDCVIGHATEVKSSIFLNGAKAGHFAYVGDTVLGNNVNLGAGTKISNLKITNTEISLAVEDKTYHTGLRKFGAIVGDAVQTGCNAVLNPGTMLGPKCMVYPNASVKAQVYKAKV
ncbi:MAG: glucose-1-phosphate thymidylyltransferase, partial [Deltaproteobacteria bacterium]|nr:glucose-1-phosphate thymidylyltransferase [Deltaproteobacteria bacterium]